MLYLVCYLFFIYTARSYIENYVDTELKAKIDAFVAERRKQLTAGTSGAEAASKMDISEN